MKPHTENLSSVGDASVSAEASEQSMVRILIAEDEEPTIDALVYILKREGYLVQGAENGRKALELLQKNKFQILITDIEMPEMNGIELLREIQDKNIEIATLVITGYGEKSLIKKLLRMGCDDFLDKPFSRDDVLQAVSRVLEKVDSQKQKFEEKLKNESFEILKQKEEMHKKADHLEKEIQSARKAHETLLKIPTSNLATMHIASRPLGTLGGDFIHLEEKNNKCYVVLADVSGHDMGASYHTVLLKSACDNISWGGMTSARILEKINEGLMSSSEEPRMVCALALIVDVLTGEVDVSSAASPKVRVIGDSGVVEKPDLVGYPLGIDGEIEQVSESFFIEKNEVVLISTDGLFDSYRVNGQSSKKEVFGGTALRNYLQVADRSSVENFSEGVIDECLRFCRFKQKDDFLLVSIKLPEG
jgi:CheY-like chemotaxis protein